MEVVLKVLVKKGSEPNREPSLGPFWGQVFRTTTQCQIAQNEPSQQPWLAFYEPLENERYLSKGSKDWMRKVGGPRWGIGNEPQYSRAYTKDPLAHLPSSHLLSLLNLGSSWEQERKIFTYPRGHLKNTQKY